MFQGCFKEVSRKFHGSSKKFQRSFKNVQETSRASKKTSKGVSMEFSVCLKGI